jgi:hypothetical protein
MINIKNLGSTIFCSEFSILLAFSAGGPIRKKLFQLFETPCTIFAVSAIG